MKRLICIFICSVILFCLCACSLGKGEKLGSINYEMDNMPRSLDPLLAQTFSEQQVAKNIFDGLVRLDENQDVVLCCAESYSVSGDGLVYTFNLLPGLLWSDKEKLTADDFAFGITRALLPETNSPWASSLFDILNAQEVNGGAAPADALGVKATGELTLAITLKAPSKNFLQSLTTLAAMPCRKDFFAASGGRYGLAKKHVVSNGAYYIRSWVDEYTDKEVVISKNYQYKGVFPAALERVTFSFGNDKERVDRLNKKIINLGILDGNMIGEAQAAGLNILSYEQSCLAFCINTDDDIFSNPTLRLALAKTVDRPLFESSLPSYLSLANYIVPSGAWVGEGFYRNSGQGSADNFSIAFDEEGAKKLFNQYIKENKGVLPTVKILYSTPELKTALSYIAQTWQRVFGIYAVPEETGLSAIQSAMASGNYQIAVCPFTPADGTAGSLLSTFRTDSGTYGSFGTKAFDSEISAAQAEQDDDMAMQRYKNAEQILIDNAAVIPLAFQLDGFAYNTLIYEIALFPRSTVIDFTATKAKYVK